MFGFGKKQNISIDFTDYVLRIIVCSNSDSEKLVYEFPLEVGTIVEETIRDEMALYEIIKQAVNQLNLNKSNVRFFVPDSTVMMKSFEHPEDIASSKLKSFVEMELGNTIHLPFTDPLIDVYDDNPNDGHATIFATPSEEIYKFIGLLDDVNLFPTIADVRGLSNIRYLEHYNLLSSEKTYLITDWSINGVSIVIYSNGKVEFMRYQSIDTKLKKWIHKTDNQFEVDFYYDGDIKEYHFSLVDQIAEIDRVLNFYSFSLYKGEKSVNEIVVMGDSPELLHIHEEMKMLYELPITSIDDSFVTKDYIGLKAKHAALIGLTLKEGV